MNKKLILVAMLTGLTGSTTYPISLGEITDIIGNLNNFVGSEVNKILKGKGINLNGIISNVTKTKSAIGSATTAGKSIPAKLQAANGPITQGKKIATQINKFKEQAVKLTQTITISDLGDALFDPTALNKINTKLGSDLKTALNNLKKSHDIIVESMNTMEIRPVLQAVQKILNTFSKAAKSIVAVRDSAGILGKTLIPDALKNSFLQVAQNFVGIANNLGQIIQGGLPNISKLERDLINGMLNNLFTTKSTLVKIPVSPTVPIEEAWRFKKEETIALEGLVTRIITTVQDTMASIKDINPHISTLTTNINRLVSTAKNIGPRLETRLKNEVTSFWNKVKSKPWLLGQLTFNPIGWVRSELNGTIKELGGYLHAVLESTQGLLQNVTGMYFKVFDAGTDNETDNGGVIHAFRVYLGTDLLPAATISGFRGIGRNLSRLTDDYGTFIGELNTLVKKFRI